MIKVSYLVSYDYYLLMTSVKQIYNNVDKIVVAIDANQKTWSGNCFSIPQTFYDEIKGFDYQNKIEFYFDNFYLPQLSPMENETRERNLVLAKLGFGWKIQLDVDEYIYDFEKVAKYLKKYWYLVIFPKLTPVCLKGKLITLFKTVPNGYLYIDNDESFPFITNQSSNVQTRLNNTVRNFQTNIKVIHQSWARLDEEIVVKINNWGHRDDFDTESFFQFWKKLDQFNYKEFKNIHPLSPEKWKELLFIEADNIDCFIDFYAKENKQIFNPISLKKLLKYKLNKWL